MSEIKYAGYTGARILRRAAGMDVAKLLHEAIQSWDPIMRNPFTAEDARRMAKGEKMELKSSIVGESKIGRGTDVARLVNDESLRYYRLYIGERKALDANDSETVFRPRGLTICDKQELIALRSIFSGEKVENILSGNGNRDKIVDEIELKGSLMTEEAPRAARLAKNSPDFCLQIGEKKVLDSKAKWAPRSIVVYRNELVALKFLFDNLKIPEASVSTVSA